MAKNSTTNLAIWSHWSELILTDWKHCLKDFLTHLAFKMHHQIIFRVRKRLWVMTTFSFQSFRTVFRAILLKYFSHNNRAGKGSCCGSAVASDSRGPRFKSSHRQKIILNIYFQLYRKDENKEKAAGNGPFFKKNAPRRQGKSITLVRGCVICSSWNFF